MSRPLRWLLDLDRVYFLALTAFVASAAASIYLLVTPVYRAVSAEGTEIRGTLIEVQGAGAIGLLIVPLFITMAPLLSLPRKTRPLQRSHRVNSVLATVMLMVFIAVTIATLGLLYVPALILAVASSVSLFFGRDRRANAAGTQTRGRRMEREGDARRQQQQGNERIRMSGGKRRRKKAR